MPIPVSDTTEAPRRLLRDVVYDKMLAAIVDGTLEPGERLNDDALCSWLGVSRTPVREAITQLHGIGLVEIEANRFTKVASLDDDLYAEAAQFLAGIHELGRQWGLGNLTKAESDHLGEAAPVPAQPHKRARSRCTEGIARHSGRACDSYWQRSDGEGRRALAYAGKVPEPT
jgi:biotin operon repressor